MKRPQVVTQPPMAAVKPTQATAAQEKKPRRVRSSAAPAAGLAATGLAAVAATGGRAAGAAGAFGAGAAGVLGGGALVPPAITGAAGVLSGGVEVREGGAGGSFADGAASGFPGAALSFVSSAMKTPFEGAVTAGSVLSGSFLAERGEGCQGSEGFAEVASGLLQKRPILRKETNTLRRQDDG